MSPEARALLSNIAGLKVSQWQAEADLVYENGDDQRAYELYRNVLNQDLRNPWPTLGIVRVLARNGDPAQAINLIDGLRQAPDPPSNFLPPPSSMVNKVGQQTPLRSLHESTLQACRTKETFRRKRRNSKTARGSSPRLRQPAPLARQSTASWRSADWKYWRNRRVLRKRLRLSLRPLMKLALLHAR